MYAFAPLPGAPVVRVAAEDPFQPRILDFSAKLQTPTPRPDPLAKGPPLFPTLPPPAVASRPQPAPPVPMPQGEALVAKPTSSIPPPVAPMMPEGLAAKVEAVKPLPILAPIAPEPPARPNPQATAAKLPPPPRPALAPMAPEPRLASAPRVAPAKPLVAAAIAAP